MNPKEARYHTALAYVRQLLASYFAFLLSAREGGEGEEEAWMKMSNTRSSPEDTDGILL